jgi:hypothetical protein
MRVAESGPRPRRERRGDRGGGRFLIEEVPWVALPPRRGGAKGGADDAHAGGAELLEGSSARLGDLLPAGAVNARGPGVHDDVRLVG